VVWRNAVGGVTEAFLVSLSAGHDNFFIVSLVVLGEFTVPSHVLSREGSPHFHFPCRPIALIGLLLFLDQFARAYFVAIGTARFTHASHGSTSKGMCVGLPVVPTHAVDHAPGQYLELR